MDVLAAVTGVVAAALAAAVAGRLGDGRWPSVLVGAEDMGRGAGVADRRCSLKIAQGDRDLALGEETLDVVHALGPAVDLHETPEGASPDACFGKSIGLDDGLDDGELEDHAEGR